MKVTKFLFGFPLIELVVVSLVIGSFFSGPVLVTEYTVQTDMISVVDDQVYNETKQIRVEFIPLQTNYSITTNSTIINELGMEFNTSSYVTTEVVSASYALLVFMVLVVAGYSLASLVTMLGYTGVSNKILNRLKGVRIVFQAIGHVGLTLLILLILSNLRVLRRVSTQDDIFLEADTSDIYVHYSGFSQVPPLTIMLLVSPILMILRAQLVKSGVVKLS